MEVVWEENGCNYKLVYWLDSLSADEFENLAEDCDDLTIWYSNNVDDEIYNRYKELISFTELNGYWKGKAGSRIVDLTLPEEEILNNFSKTRKYKTRRALERDNLHTSFISEYSKESLLSYEEFYNHFADGKGLGRLNTFKVSAMMKKGQFMIASINNEKGEILVINAYVVDTEKKRVSLFSSSSLYRENKDIAAIIGRANGMLHYESMLYFKEQGFKEYDMGGVYLGKEEGVPSDYINVRNFKKSLGGELVEFENGFSLPVKELRIIKANIDLLREELKSSKVIIWGAAQYGRYVIRLLAEMGIEPEFIIDNGLSNEDNNLCKQNVLKNINADEYIILVTTVPDTYEKIIKERMVQKFVNKKKMYCIRQRYQDSEMR